jgi:chemotaxis protein CheX
MPTTQEISENLIRENINRAIGEVFKTMLGRQAELCVLTNGSAVSVDEQNGIAQIVGTVGFLGDVNGLIYLYLDVPFARTATSQMLGMTEAEVDEAGDEVVNDAIGELTNMTVGSFKNGLSDAGFPCRLTIPTILRGSNFSIEPIAEVQRFIYKFQSAGQSIVTDILIKLGD